MVSKIGENKVRALIIYPAGKCARKGFLKIVHGQLHLKS